MNIKRNDIIYVVLLVVVAVLMFVLNTNTPFLHDDFAYHFYYDKHSEMVRPTSIPIISFWEIIPSMWHHYCCVNGRFTSHIILQVFCSLMQYLDVCVVVAFIGTFIFTITFCSYIECCYMCYVSVFTISWANCTMDDR